MLDHLVSVPETSPSSLMQQQRYKDAIELLKSINYSEPSADNLAMLALAYFHTEQYDLAAANYEKALQLDPSNKDWQEMAQHARNNAVSEVNVPVPEVYYFERDKLLSKPVVPDSALPQKPLPVTGKPGLLKKLRVALGNAAGAVATVTMEAVTTNYGKIAGYTGKIWTNWYRRPLLLSILTLAYMREKINAHNLKSAYPSNTLVGFQADGQTAPEGAKYFRTADGSWNNLDNPKEGAAGTRFSRNVAVEAIKPETGERLLTPNPRELSRHLLTRTDGMKEVSFLNLLAASWIQFQNHDWIN
ncbi:MAG: tetratricopeptide repeat protein, partial [Bacteroidota bacterium]|nr:tetratricopeptide repeat protein [Bacteroidota bacterium]